jgi:hypothetical protein
VTGTLVWNAILSRMVVSPFQVVVVVNNPLLARAASNVGVAASTADYASMELFGMSQWILRIFPQRMGRCYS